MEYLQPDGTYSMYDPNSEFSKGARARFEAEFPELAKLDDPPADPIVYSQPAASNKMPDLLAYQLEHGTLPPPTAGDYQKALDPADKNFTSVNNSSFKPIGGAAGVGLNEPVQVQNTIIKEVQNMSFLKIAVLCGVGFFAYKKFFKGKSK